MKRLVLLPLVIVAGCGGGERITETREVAPFDRLEVSESVDVQVVPGDGREVRVAAGEHVIDRVVTTSSGGVLKIDIRDRGIVIGSDPLDDVEVQVPASDLAGVDIEGSGDVVLEGLDQQALELRDRGSRGRRGQRQRRPAHGHDPGRRRRPPLDKLSVRTARVVVQGAADAELNVSDELDVTVAGRRRRHLPRRSRRFGRTSRAPATSGESSLKARDPGVCPGLRGCGLLPVASSWERLD